MEDTILTMMIIGLIVGSLIGGVVLMTSAKFVGKVTSAKYWNSFFICLIATGTNYLIWYIIGEEAFKMEFIQIFIISFLLLSVLYIVISKMIWKCSWLKAIKANIIWIVINAAIMGYGLSQIS